MKQKTLAEAWDNIISENIAVSDLINGYDNIVKHDQTKLTIGDFIPCKDGEPLINNYKGAFEEIADEKFSKQYQQALDRVVYKGWELYGKNSEAIWIENGNDESITFFSDGIIERNYYKQIETRGDMAGFELMDNYAKKLYGWNG